MEPKYKRILLKISGEALAGNKKPVSIMTPSPPSVKVFSVLHRQVSISVSSSAAETSGADALPEAWTEQDRTIWECLRP